MPLDYIDECGFETVKIKNYKLISIFYTIKGE